MREMLDALYQLVFGFVVVHGFLLDKVIYIRALGIAVPRTSSILLFFGLIVLIVRGKINKGN